MIATRLMLANAETLIIIPCVLVIIKALTYVVNNDILFSYRFKHEMKIPETVNQWLLKERVSVSIIVLLSFSN